MRRALNQSQSFDTASLEDMDGFMLCIFLEEDKLKKETARRFGNLIFSVAVVKIDNVKRVRGRGIP